MAKSVTLKQYMDLSSLHLSLQYCELKTTIQEVTNDESSKRCDRAAQRLALKQTEDILPRGKRTLFIHELF
jgi:hypothetical protein